MALRFLCVESAEGHSPLCNPKVSDSGGQKINRVIDVTQGRKNDSQVLKVRRAWAWEPGSLVQATHAHPTTDLWVEIISLGLQCLIRRLGCCLSYLIGLLRRLR